MSSHLYRDVLESILSFSSLRDLAVASCTSQAWRRSVEGMRPISASVVPCTLMRIPQSSALARHITRLHDPKFESCADQSILAAGCALTHLRNLRSIEAAIDFGYDPWPTAQEFVFPASVTDFDVQMRNGDCNTLMEAISVVPQLRSFRFHYPFIISGFKFAPFLAAQNLQRIEIVIPRAAALYDFTSAHLQILRRIPHLTSLRTTKMSEAALVELLQLPCLLRLVELGECELFDSSAAIAALMSQSESLCSLRVRLHRSADFFTRLPHLTSLTVRVDDSKPSTAQIIRELQSAAARSQQLVLRVVTLDEEDS